MKFSNKARVASLVAALAASISAGVVHADTGFSGAGGAGASASANLNGAVVVPNVLLLRVGDASAVTKLTFEPEITIPGGQAAWTGAPLTSTSPTKSVQAFAYTNNAAGAKLTCATTGLGGLTDYLYGTDITVAATLSPGITDLLGHPGADLSCGSSSASIVRNSVFAANWTYTLLGASVINYLPGGTHNFTVGYTLTNL